MSAPSDQHVSQHDGGPLAIVPVEGEPRIRDLDLADRLGFVEPLAIRKLIKRHRHNLLKMNTLSTMEQVVSHATGATKSETFWLTRKQAIFITAKSETVNATEITIEIIERFDAYERGLQVSATVAEINVRDPRQLATITAQLIEVNRELQAENREQQAALAIAAPKVDAYEEFIKSDGELTIDAAAKMLLRWSGQRLYRRLQDAGWVDRRNGINTPRLWVIQQGFMAVRPTTLPNGRIYSQPMFTPKGVAALRLAVRDGDLFLGGIDRARLLPSPTHSRPN